MRQGHTRDEIGGQDLGLASVLVSVLGGPIAWSAHFGICYFLVALACTTSWRGPSVAIVILAVTVVFGAASAVSGVIAYRRWRSLGGGGAWDEALTAPAGRGGFLWILGMLLSGLFTLLIVLEGLPPLFVSTCAPRP